MNRQTTLAKNNDVPQEWIHIDATDQVLGRLSTQIAMILMGKNKPTYTPHHDVGDFVVVTNAEKIKVTGKKLDQKIHQTYSGHPSGRKVKTFREVLAKHPERLLEESVRRMLPKNKLGTKMSLKLKVYAGADHPHSAQNPQPLALQSA
ncbi:MAG: 50S ribosomal protein L13 [Phycisphaeraceae bacterium]